VSGPAKLSWRGKLVLSVLSPLVVFGLLEVALRIGGFRYEPWKAHLAGKTYDELKQRELYAPHPDLIWTLRPSTILNNSNLGFLGARTNSHGLRGAELPETKGPDDFHVLVLGDSTSFCLGLLDGETWPEQMQIALRTAPEMAGKHVHVINAAIPGHSSVQGRRNMERLSFLEPDMIVFWHGLPDSHDMYDLPDSMQSLPVGGVAEKLAYLWELRVFQLVQKVVTGARQASVEGKRVSLEEFRENVENLRELERAGGPKVIFVREPEQCRLTIGQLEQVVGRAEEERVECICAPLRLLTWIVPAPEGIDLTGRIVMREGKSTLRFAPDPRYSDYGESECVWTVERLRADLLELKELKRSLDERLALLPDGSLGYRDLFGDTPAHEVFADNCHIKALAARLAGERIARAAIEALASAPSGKAR